MYKENPKEHTEDNKEEMIQVVQFVLFVLPYGVQIHAANVWVGI